MSKRSLPEGKEIGQESEGQVEKTAADGPSTSTLDSSRAFYPETSLHSSWKALINTSVGF